jgi:3-hydroxymyristoyl/3-hydroxydecanoyl-(acyl carrier protein) dehydratase
MLPTSDAIQALISADGGDGKATGSAQFSHDLPVLRGHFPGNPLIPGVYTIALIAELARRTGVAYGSIKSIQKAKWSQPVYPGHLLHVSLSSTAQNGGWRIDGEVKKSDVVCLTCRLFLSE